MNILGIEGDIDTITLEDVTKAYRRAARMSHPDSIIGSVTEEAQRLGLQEREAKEFIERHVREKEEEFKRVQEAYNILSDEIKRRNVTCGTICESGHEGSWQALDSQIGRFFEKLRDAYNIYAEKNNVVKSQSGQDLTEEQADIALVELGLVESVQQLNAFREQIRNEAEVPANVNIFFNVPANNTELFWVGEDYGAGHFNKAGTRIHISLPFIKNRGIETGIAVANHEMNHIKGIGHIEPNDYLGKKIQEAIRADWIMRQEVFIAPELIYMRFNALNFPLIETLPSTVTKMPQSFITHLDNDIPEDEIVLVYENKGHLKFKKKVTFRSAERIAKELGIDTSDKKLMLSLFVSWRDNPQQLAGRIDVANYLEEEISYDFSKKPELKSIIYKGREYSLDEFKQAIPDLFRDAIELMRSLSSVEEGQYLYRGITESEWRHIREEGIFTVLEGTNFEKNIGSQVKFYYKDEKYAGVIIRVSVVGPYFQRAGLQVPRIVAVIPHFAKPEILLSDPDAPEQIWISVEEYLRRQEVNSRLESARNIEAQI